MLGVFLLNTVRSYERESAATALTRVEELTEEISVLEQRIRNLESIASIDPKSVEDLYDQSTAASARNRNRTRI
ncbi:MAG: hypothetical protein HKN43_08135 [Rhodothermales bacterium]|nr:hypothetical protein [Rhodothermales bacterium]